MPPTKSIWPNLILDFPAELKILDDPLPFKRSTKKSDKDEEEVAIQDVSTDVNTLLYPYRSPVTGFI